MRLAEREQHWQHEAEEILVGFMEWRQQHPHATLSALEEALDERWAVARARILQDAALASTAANLRAVPAEERPRCPQCGELMEVRGPEERHLTTTYEQPISLRRQYAVCAACNEALFPPR